ncbi:hypothetical protein B23_2793 [Geobacillus thermoleovorans B23]|nr:hypothetical protein B23_2793 [Geobacillus thermoleovorans B23]
MRLFQRKSRKETSCFEQDFLFCEMNCKKTTFIKWK